MGAGSGKRKRVLSAASVAPPLVSSGEREWYEVDVDGLPDIDDAKFAGYERSLNRVIEKLLSLQPDWKPLIDSCHWFFDASEVGPHDFGYVNTEEDNHDQSVVAVYTRAAEECSEEHLLFLLAHELTHIELGHTANVAPGVPTGAQQKINTRRPRSSAGISERMRWRATEGLVNDSLAARGIVVPEDFPMGIPYGEQAIGFNLYGLNRREVWDVVDGRMSRADLQELVKQRAGRPEPDSDWNGEVMKPSEAALAFWKDRRGGWRPEWAEAHDQLVAQRKIEMKS